MEWIGVTFAVHLQRKVLSLMVAEKMVLEVRETCEEVLGRSMVGFKRLERLAGRLFWMAGVMPRTRWVVSVVYATLVPAKRDLLHGTEEKRRHLRQDDCFRLHC